MDHRVEFLPSFLRDLEAIVRRIAVDNPSAAYRVGLRIIALAESLAVFPERYPRVRQRPELRRFVVLRHFKVFYRIDAVGRRVEVLRCWDGRRGEPGWV